MWLNSKIRRENREVGKYQDAISRIDATPELGAFRDALLYDWPEGDEHWQWVTTASVSEIVDWAQTVEGG